MLGKGCHGDSEKQRQNNFPVDTVQMGVNGDWVTLPRGNNDKRPVHGSRIVFYKLRFSLVSVNSSEEKTLKFIKYTQS